MKRNRYLFVLCFFTATIVAAENPPMSPPHQKIFNNLCSGSLVQMRIDDLKQENTKLWELIHTIENQYKAKTEEQIKSWEAKQNELLNNIKILSKQKSDMETKTLELEDLLIKEKETSIKEKNKNQQEISTLKVELEKYLKKNTYNFEDSKILKSYISGILYSNDIKAMLKAYDSININLELNSLMAGLKDGLNETAQLESKKLKYEKDKFLALVKKRESEVYKKSISEIKKAIGGKRVAKQNQSAFFVVTHSGKDDYKQGDEVTFDLKIEKLDGMALQHDKSAKIVYQDSMPYVLNQALNLARKGGKTEIYGLASDFFAIGEVPESITNLTPVKIIVNTELK